MSRAEADADLTRDVVRITLRVVVETLRRYADAQPGLAPLPASAVLANAASALEDAREDLTQLLLRRLRERPDDG